MDVRNEIDNIDFEIIRLLSTRSEYVREVVKYKDTTVSGIQAADRRAAVLESRGQWAREAGIQPEVIENVYNLLIDYYIGEEMKLANIHREGQQ